MSRPASNGITGSLGKPSGIKKRKADDELRSEQRLAKRFDLLNLEQNGKLYLPIQPHPPHTNGTHTHNHNHDHDNTDSMSLDDTKHKLYIHNLDHELAAIDSEEEEKNLVFLPDIEKKLGKIPKSVLLGEGYPGPGSAGNEMVLYSVPSSLSVPEEQDKVRKAIIESRARARERQVRGAEAEVEVEVEGAPGGNEEGRGGDGEVKGEGGVDAVAAAGQVTGVEDDEDAMDLG